MKKHHSQIIVALDFGHGNECLEWLDQLDPQLCAVKIGSELFTQAGPDIVKQCIARGFRVFLDLKFHDIPHTVAKATTAAAELGVWMLNVHALGGIKMLQAAREALVPFGSHRPLLIAVTVLTSHDELSLKEIGIERALKDQVISAAQLTFDSGLDGIVCSSWEVPSIKAQFGSSFLTVTPGIRMPGDEMHDQVRVLTPSEAQKQGSDYLVIGRALRRFSQPLPVLQKIVQELNSD